MTSLENKRVLVLGFGKSGRAATELLQARGAKVVLVDSADTPEMRRDAAAWIAQGIEVHFGQTREFAGQFDLVVVSPGVPWSNPVLEGAIRRSVPVIGELELGYEHARCLHIAITGTNGKTTTTELVERLVTAGQFRTLAAGNIGLPICSVVERTKDLDFLTLEVSSFQLETTRYFRPVIGVLLNITPDHLDRYSSMSDYAQAKARLFLNQQPFDWAIVQSEALAQLRALKVNIPSKLITFSASNRRADIFLDRTLIVSQINGWTGPLLDMSHGRLYGPHNAENLMAALAVARVLRIPLETAVESLKSYQPAAHRCELVTEIGGVRFINDSKATNLDAVEKALLSMPAGPQAGEPNIWLIAGGRDKQLEYYEIGPLLSRRVKGAILIGETREKIRAAWSLFTPCTLANSLLEAVAEAARSAVAGDVVLLSPACSSFDQFQDYQHRGEVFRQAVLALQSSGETKARAAGESRPGPPR